VAAVPHEDEIVVAAGHPDHAYVITARQPMTLQHADVRRRRRGHHRRLPERLVKGTADRRRLGVAGAVGLTSSEGDGRSI
jgi:hypothetical protein